MTLRQHKNQEFLNDLIVVLKELRLSRGLTLEDVYNDTGIHIARIESGKSNITINTLYDLSNYYKLPLKDLFSKL